MNTEFFVTIYNRNTEYTPWNGQEEYCYDDHEFETSAEALSFFITRKQEWLHFAEENGMKAHTWETETSIYFAVVDQGIVRYKIELWPKPEDCDDDLPW